MVDFTAARMNMVDSQLRTNRVTDPRVLGAFETVPRERFVPEHLRSIAYVDEDLKIADGRYLMEPMVLARLLDAARIDASDVVLIVGAATGYACALTARIAATVVGLESDKDLAKQAEAMLSDQVTDNAVIVKGDLAKGYPKQAPYNVILINGAVEDVPERITDQLADGGRLLTVVKNGPGMGKAVLMERIGDAVGRRTLFDAATPVLPGFTREKGFVF
ncbi:protein-L-isoaspartate O-methyltransferase family protein [Ferruginivarius sediminum]|uniref:Protein-L-isoaspartate O-methyltransferase n=1 Tax=Ferruginivarius sediminum TaxID=2661937 RepID=A0A369TF64_9PROT|nr:protein-L-isoaspartate O-methyltransferase [Ferruginivarius sediminum]RDD63908.1 protein-L-isoaspartate O-methyltransferase [Ferruginivarius sediminum]